MNEQVLSTVYSEITGTTITYTPDPNASKVVYEYRIMAHNDPDTNNTSGFLELQENINSTWTSLFDNGTPGFQTYEQHTFGRYQAVWYGKYVLPAYSGSKSYRLAGRNSTTTQESTVHGTEDGNTVHPQVTMYSVID